MVEMTGLDGDRPLCILIGALGGQGGGVLANWLDVAARQAGYPVQATSTPGVAQRTGATTYYVELFPNKNPVAEPVFCLFPSAGDVDMLVGLEPTEAAKALERGYITSRTVVVSSTERIYSTAEKSVAGNGAVSAMPVLAALQQAARRLLAVEPAAAPHRPLNAVIFGAMLGSGVLPLTAADGRAAIIETGLAVEANLAGFESGLELAAKQWQPPGAETPAFAFCPEAFQEELAQWPAALRPWLGHSLARLVDYQDETYARLYLQRLAPVLASDHPSPSYRLTAEVVRQLAAWMSYEDAIRVAQLKTRPGRLGRIREEVRAKPGEPVAVHDYLSPGRAEFVSLLPASLARLVPGGSRSEGRSLHLAWPTTSPLAYGVLKGMARMRWLRPRTVVYQREQAAMERWLTAVQQAAAVDYELACLTAETAVLARGYGAVRRRGLACLGALWTDWPQKLAQGGEEAREAVTAVLHTARHEPDQIGYPD